MSKQKAEPQKNSNWEKGMVVYFNHPTESWIKGEIVEQDDKKVTSKVSTPFQCKGQGEPVWVGPNDICLYKEDIESARNDDLLEMTELHEVSLLKCVENRYKEDKIYTFIGGLILSLNPFKWTIPYCQEDYMANYIEGKKGHPPQCWQIADKAHKAMKNGEGNQTLMISGESGAGKTEACKSVIRYLCKLSSSLTHDTSIKEMSDSIGVKIQQASPILEAFGNAKTKNNDNSSRFGKFIKLQFDSHGIIKGASTENYLLEKSRLMKQGPNERSYHVFYQILSGMDESKKKELHLTKAEDYPSIMQGNCAKVDTIDDVQEYHSMVEAMKIVGINDATRDTIFSICAAILHLQRVIFKPQGDAGSTIENDVDFTYACNLLQVDKAALQKALTVKVYSVMNKIFESPLTPEQAADSRDALSKSLYSNMFDWIVRKINENTNSSDSTSFIGLLDIFGFEKFDFNTFEQFCINFANEALQAHYNSYTFKRDKKECEVEGIDVSEISFRDNQPCLDMIQGTKSGILKLLDDQCLFPSATDQKFFDMVVQAYKTHEFFGYQPLFKEDFIVKHYAGEVKYNIRDWLEKNKDVLRDDIIDVLSQSKVEFIAKTICPEKKDFTKKDKKPSTVTGSFKKQLVDLLDLINSTTPHWIRTIKPHPAKKAGMWSNSEVMKQLSSSGVLETIRIRREGYSVRIPLESFFKRYNVISGEGFTSDFKVSSEKIIKEMNFGKDIAQVGKTKVFMKSDAYTLLELSKNKKLEKYIVTLQKFTRGFLGRCVARKRREEIRIKKEKEEYERNKEIFERMIKEKNEKNRIEKEKRDREEKERLEREEKEREERERLEKMMQERDRIERERREAEEMEKRKLEILKAKQKERILELQRIEKEREEKERLEKERLESLRRKAEDEKQVLVRMELEKRKEALKEKEHQRIMLEKQQRIQERRDQMNERRREREKVEKAAEERKQKAIEQLEMEKAFKKQKDSEIQRIADLARMKLEQERIEWEKKQWDILMQEVLEEEMRKERRQQLEKEKLRKVEESQKIKQQKHLEKTVVMYEREKKSRARKALIQAEKDDMIQLKKEYSEHQKQKLLQKRQELEVQVIEKQAHLQWEVDKEKRREEMRQAILQKIRNEKSRENWREVDTERKEMNKRLESDRQIFDMERLLQAEANEFHEKVQQTKLQQKSQQQQEYLMSKREQAEYDYQLQKLKQKITGVFASSPQVSEPKVALNTSLSSPRRSSSPRAASPRNNASPRKTNTTQPSINQSSIKTIPSPIVRPATAQSLNSSKILTVKKGGFSKLY